MLKGIVLAAPRTGSTFLVDCLNSHPDLEAHHGSWDLMRNKAAPRLIHDRSEMGKFNNLQDMIKEGPDILVKMGYETVQVYDLFSALRTLNAKGLPIIHLIRENSLARVLSELLIHDPDKRTIRDVDGEPWDISMEELMQLVLLHERERLTALDAFEDSGNIVLMKYADLFEGDHLAWPYSERVCRLLGVPFVPMRSDVQKNIKRPFSFFFNEEQMWLLKTYLEEEGMEWMLEREAP